MKLNNINLNVNRLVSIFNFNYTYLLLEYAVHECQQCDEKSPERKDFEDPLINISIILRKTDEPISNYREKIKIN